MAARVWPISHVRSSRLFGALVLICPTLLFSSQRALAQFSQQGPKLVGTGAIGYAEQGYSVALSGDGNTAIVGGPGDNSKAPGYYIGAAWVFVWGTNNDCKDGGWRNFVSSPGPFKNQGQCVSYFATQ